MYSLDCHARPASNARQRGEPDLASKNNASCQILELISVI